LENRRVKNNKVSREIVEAKIGEVRIVKTKKEKKYYNLIKIVIKGLEVEIVEKIKKVRNKNKKVVKIVEKIKKAEVKVLRGEK